MKLQKKKITLGLLTALVISGVVYAAALTVEVVGDPDSFGRAAKFAGVRRTATIEIRQSCVDPSGAPIPRCFVFIPNADISFNERDLGYVLLPADTMNSMLCQHVHHDHFYRMASQTLQAARFVKVMPYYSISSPAIDGMSFSDPFNPGQTTLGFFDDTFGALIDEQDFGTSLISSRPQFTRSCEGGIINVRRLLNLGLNADQIAKFYAEPIKISFHLRGSTRNVDSAFFRYGVRFTVD